MSKNVRKLISPRVLCTSIKNRVLSWFDRFTALIHVFEQKYHKLHNSTSCVHKYHKSCSLANLTVLRLLTRFWTKLSHNSYLREFCCTSVTNRVVSCFDRFTAYYYGMSKNVRKIISPPVYCSSITNRVFSWFDRFTDYFYCMRKKIHKTHISTSFVHKSPKSCS